jgi:small-conductance mechanosensitive channel
VHVTTNFLVNRQLYCILLWLPLWLVLLLIWHCLKGHLVGQLPYMALICVCQWWLLLLTVRIIILTNIVVWILYKVVTCVLMYICTVLANMRSVCLSHSYTFSGTVIDAIWTRPAIDSHMQLPFIRLAYGTNERASLFTGNIYENVVSVMCHRVFRVSCA